MVRTLDESDNSVDDLVTTVVFDGVLLFCFDDPLPLPPPPPRPVPFVIVGIQRPPFGANDSVRWVRDFVDSDEFASYLLLALAFSYFFLFEAAAASCRGFISLISK
jgi:hypothetical protein